MKPQLILACTAGPLIIRTLLKTGVSPMSFETACKHIADADLILKRRDGLEVTEEYLQLIPYAVLKQNGKYVKYTRTEVSGEEKLRNRVSIGAGGHIDGVDIFWNSDSTVDVSMTIKGSVMRELSEEFNITSRDILSENWDIGILFDTSDAVGRVHVGIVAVIELSNSFHIESQEENIAKVKLATLDELEQDRQNMEKWSAHVLDYLKATRDNFCETMI